MFAQQMQFMLPGAQLQPIVSHSHGVQWVPSAPSSCPVCSERPQPCAWAQDIVCAAQSRAESSRGVSDATLASPCKLGVSFPLVTGELWDSGLQGSYHQLLIWSVDDAHPEVAQFQWILFWIVVLHWYDADSLGLDVLHCWTKTGGDESSLDFNPF